MIFASVSHFQIYLPWGLFSIVSFWCLKCKALEGAFNQEKVLVGAFSVIVKLRVIFGNLHFKLY